jgi:hypothetical protein
VLDPKRVSNISRRALRVAENNLLDRINRNSGI